MGNSNVNDLRCENCKQPYVNHGPDGKCLFEATHFGPTENLRMALARDINVERAEREALEKQWGQVWDTQQVQADFQIHGFGAPFVSVTRRADGTKGVLTFQHLPRYYFAFQPL